MEIINKVNIDYEYSLFDPHYLSQFEKYQKYNRDFEYLFFFDPKKEGAVFSEKGFSGEYIKKIESFGLKNLNFYIQPKKIDNFWWGANKNIELERKTNSKITSILFGKEKCYLPEGTEVISCEKDLFNKLNKLKGKWILKHPYRMSGRGFYFFSEGFSAESILKKFRYLKKSTESIIVEPFLEIQKNYGVLEDETGNLYFHENIIGSNGQYLGSKILESKNIPLIALETIKYYRNLGAKGFLGVDLMVDVNDRIYLCEVNNRKSMGLILHYLSELFGHKSCSMRIFKKNTDIKNSKAITISPDSSEHIATFLPEDSF